MLNKIIFSITAFLLFIFLTACEVQKNPFTYGLKTGPNMCSVTQNKNIEDYKIYGKQYHILGSSKNYEEKGIASWYGRRFHKKRTSSGERYNMYKLTAAHKTLPLQSRVLVTNLKNGKNVIVKVNDRGPFVSNRLIDLSYGAAKKLGILGAGLAEVKIKAIPEG